MNGGLAFGCTNRATVSRPWWRAPRTKPLAAMPYVARGAERDEESITGTRGARALRGPARVERKLGAGSAIHPPKGGARGTGHGIAARKGGARAPWSLSEEGASDRGKYRRFTTSVWKRSRRASRNRRRAHRENARRLRPVSAWLATGVSEARSYRVRVPLLTRGRAPHSRGRVEQAHMDASDPPKRQVRREAHGLRSRWAAPHRVHARRRAADDEPETEGVRVLVDGVLGSRDGSDASLIPPAEAIARSPGRAGPSRKGIVAPSAETPRLTRTAVERRRTGARIVRGVLPDEAHGWMVHGVPACGASP